MIRVLDLKDKAYIHFSEGINLNLSEHMHKEVLQCVGARGDVFALDEKKEDLVVKPSRALFICCLMLTRGLKYFVFDI